MSTIQLIAKRTAKDAVVVVPLQKWEKLLCAMEELEITQRYHEACTAAKGEKGISLKQLRKKSKL